MPLATYKDLCIDAVDAPRMGDFWGGLLALEVTRLENGDAKLTGPRPRHTIWVNAVPEPTTAKQRVHLDIWLGAVADAERLGAVVVAELPRWTVMRDPEGGELCVFTSDDNVETPRHVELVVDTGENPQPVAQWWGDVLGARVHDDERGYSYVDAIPDCPLRSIAFVPVPEPKTGKNRIHLDVVAAAAELLDAGAQVLPHQDDAIGWTVLTDPEGNEFCVFPPAG